MSARALHVIGLSLLLTGMSEAGGFVAVWQLGADDGNLAPFSQESWGPNNPPGSPTVKDDDYYFSGSYPAPVGVVSQNESPANFERAATSGDPRKRIHFPLTVNQASSHSLLRVTVDLMGGGAWVNQSIPGFSTHDLRVTFNGNEIAVRNAVTWNTTISVVVPASSVSAVAGANVLQVERTGGAAGGYIGFDYLKLEADDDALMDADGDGMPLWFEETYGFSDTDPGDAELDHDGDGLTNVQEFESGTNPTDPHSDNDGLSDSDEVTRGTNPLNEDTDGDGLSDSQETVSNPLLADTDGDGFPDNVEIEGGSNPADASSTPFSFSGAIGFQFVTERLVSARLGAGEPAGYFRHPHWNSSDPLPQWVGDGVVLTGSRSALKNHRGQTTTAAISWSSHFSGDGLHKGPGDERLLNGMIRTQKTSTIDVPVRVDLTGIPYASYDVIAYVGRNYPATNAFAYIRLGSAASTDRFMNADSAPPFPGWREITATTQAAVRPGNFVRYRNLSGASQTLTLRSINNEPVSLHGIQIVENSRDLDGDGMKDLLEIEHGFDPRTPDANADPDLDGMSNLAEITAGTDPKHPDTDRDGLKDGEEATHGTSPLNPDSDADWLLDGDEVFGKPFTSSPVNPDTDGDGFRDAVERAHSSNPRDSLSTPPPVPVWDGGTRTWLWRVDNLRILWNHEQSTLGAIDADEAMLCEAIADIEQSGWNRQIGIGIRYIKGKLVHRFRGIEGVFHQSGNVNSGYWVSDWNTTPVDRTRAFGFSGHGPADDSVPLRFEFTATQPTAGTNLWSIRFTISDMSVPASPVVLSTYSSTSAVAAHPSLLNGTTVWRNQAGESGRIELRTEPGVKALITRTAPGTSDADSDGMPDAWETSHQFNPGDAADANLDWDLDGLSNLREFLAGTNPRNPDSDGDGVPDGVEVSHGTNPLAASSFPAWYQFSGTIDDLDGDGLSDAWILWSGGRPRFPGADDDGDGMTNLQESLAGTDPDDPSSKFDLTSWRSGDDLVLSWTHFANKAQHLVSSPQMGQWSRLATMPPVTFAGERRQTVFPDEFSSQETRFFRAGISPVDSDGDGVEDWVEENVLGSSPTAPASLGQPLVRGNGQTLGGDAVALLDRLQGSSASGGPPGSVVPARPSMVNASRFLMQATFGPTPASIQELQSLGYAAWIDRQISLPPSLHQPYIREIKKDAAGPRIDPTYNFNTLDRFVHGNNATTPFARAAIAGEDQLRQRVAFALSQILVISRRDANLEEKAEAVTHYYDVLVRNALGNYGDLLKEVTFHPAMGWYLSHAGNQKADPSIPRYPDENYAREVMQLFSIGLWELNPDGSRKLDSAGDPIPTYDNGTITDMARVFTGLYFASPYGWGGGGWADEHFTRPMVMYADRHDFEAKRLPHGVVIPAREPTEQNAIRDVKDAVEALFLHPNTPPFVCKQLIQFLVLDNPSPGYVRRVQDVFVDDGQGVRGNLSAVVKAILLDPEARNFPVSPSYGKVREPVVRTMHLARLMHLAETSPKFVWWNWTDNYYAYSIQEPLNSPSVFNFYTPVYQAPGEIRNSGMVSPGFQIINTFSAVSFPNLMWDYLHDGFKSGWQWNFPMDHGDPLLLASDPSGLVEHVNLLVCAGSMTARTRGILLSALANPSLSSKDRVALAVWTAMSCPEGVVQR